MGGRDPEPEKPEEQETEDSLSTAFGRPYSVVRGASPSGLPSHPSVGGLGLPDDPMALRSEICVCPNKYECTCPPRIAYIE
eukprot:NODE_5724_length_391_cov_70.660819_g5025_i0.p3 GENE.NODE_5724_length_391_cov_70.660819_g5025_i0~~NODE_5724_length_391_cov_70.660819_g5025_i0.p3  ORF type:complete len:81 (+),score=9.53 NODE_5724_length_391_cov_70.660819_g5025_i0:31-273(+)